MDITVSAAEADRTFPDLLQGVREGKTYTVTDHGRPVATLAPVAVKREGDRKAALRRLLARLASQPAQNLPKLTRDEMHERD